MTADPVERMADIVANASRAAHLGADGAIGGALAAGGSVSIAGFGTFESRRREARTGRNPATGELVAVAARTVPVFKPSRGLRDRVDG